MQWLVNNKCIRPQQPFFVVFSLFSDHAHAREIAKVAAMVIDETYRFKGGVFC